jgi:hypothetical protein
MSSRLVMMNQRCWVVSRKAGTNPQMTPRYEHCSQSAIHRVNILKGRRAS